MFTLLIYLCESSVELLKLLKLQRSSFLCSVFCFQSQNLSFTLPHLSINFQASITVISFIHLFELTFTTQASELIFSLSTSINFEASIIRFNNLFGSIIITIPTTQVVVTIDTNPSTPSRQIHLFQSKNWTISFNHHHTNDTSRCHHWCQPDDTIETDSLVPIKKIWTISFNNSITSYSKPSLSSLILTTQAQGSRIATFDNISFSHIQHHQH